MNKAQKEVLQAGISDEQHTIKLLQAVYKRASKDCAEKISALSARTDMENLQSIIWQKQYQQALKKQLDGIVDQMGSEQFTTVADYLQKCYTNGYTGVMYDLNKQGIPVITPINQKQVVKAIDIDSKISKGLYTRMGEDVDYLKKSIRAEVSRGVANGSSWGDIAQHIAKGMSSPFDRAINNTIRIARTEGHRVQQQSTLDAQKAAQETGAKIKKQWCSTLDDRTRDTHRQLDGVIVDVDEEFTLPGGLHALYPGGFGDPAEDCNCRCCLLQRAVWGLDKEELETLKERADYFNLDKSDQFEDFKEKYLHLPEDADKVDLDNLHPDTLAGVQRGEPMSFEEADTGNVNPHYGSDLGYSINCQSCVPTFEARQRGYNVEVLPNKRGSMLEKLARDASMIWVDPVTGKHPEYLKDETATTPKKYLKFLQDIIQPDARYSIQFGWKGRRSSGHIVNLDRTVDGLLRIKDNQRGKGERSEWIGDADVLSYLDRMKYTTSFYGTKYPCVPKVLRIDNMEFDDAVASKVMKGFGK